MSGDLSPPDWGNSAFLGTCTSCNTSSLVSLARSDSLPFWSFAENPLVLVGTMKPRIDSASLILPVLDRKSTRLNSSHANISYAVFCLNKKNSHTLAGHACAVHAVRGPQCLRSVATQYPH